MEECDDDKKNVGGHYDDDVDDGDVDDDDVDDDNKEDDHDKGGPIDDGTHFLCSSCGH